MQNKQTANLVLGIVFVAFLAALVLSYFYSQLFSVKLIRFVLEAALIGGLADWFAVTALFRKPLGFPYHTAIIPNNRAKVINAIALMVEGELLNLEAINQKLAELKLVPKILAWAKAQTQQEQVQALLTSLLQKLSGRLQPAELAQYLETELKAYLATIQVAPLLNKLIKQLLADQQWQTELLAELSDRAAQPTTRTKIYSFLSVRKASLPKLLDFLLEKTNTLNLTEAADSLHLELVATLEKISTDPQHPIRRELAQLPVNLLEKLTERPVWLETVEDWKAAILEQLPLQQVLAPEQFSTQLAGVVTQELNHYLDCLEQDQDLQDWLEAEVLASLRNLITAEHHMVGTIVQETLNALTDDKLNQFIEEKAGNDLQWIRINGSMVGGVIGLVLFLVLNFVYDPMVVPVIRGWFVP